MKNYTTLNTLGTPVVCVSSVAEGAVAVVAGFGGGGGGGNWQKLNLIFIIMFLTMYNHLKMRKEKKKGDKKASAGNCY